MTEHAHPADSGARADVHVDAFAANIAWDKVQERYQHAVHGAGDGLAVDGGRIDQPIVLDVRRAGFFEQALTMLPGAAWRDPARVSEWAGELPADREVIVYCVFGREVSRSTAMQLRAAGINARYLAGGIDAWQKSGQAVQAKGVGAERSSSGVN